MRFAAALAILITSPVCAKVTCLTVTTDRPAKVNVHGAKRDEYKTSHVVMWDCLPNDTYFEYLVTATDHAGTKVSQTVRVDSGTMKTAFLSFANSGADSYRYFWLWLGLGAGWFVVYSYWTWRRCRIAEREQLPSSKQLKSGGTLDVHV